MSRSAEMLDRRDALVAALEGLQRGQHKISISAVARKAGVTPALIHNTYPDVAERIRAVSGRDASASRGKEDALLKSLESLGSKKVMFKLSLPTIPGFYTELAEHPNVLRVVALSGGYSRTEADRKSTRLNSSH